MTEANNQDESATGANEPQEISDDALEQATGGVVQNQTLLVYRSTFVPFDSDF